MTIATDMGFEIGKMYRVIDDEGSTYYKTGMIVKFERDDSSDCPWFKYVYGPVAQRTHDSEFCIFLLHLEPLDVVPNTPIKSNKDLLMLYVKQHHPLDSTLIALVESI